MKTPAPITHAELVLRACSWLARKCHCSAVMRECGAPWGEQPDAIGFRSGSSYLIECKASFYDLCADVRKPHRMKQSHGMGQFRWYLVPEGLLSEIVDLEGALRGWGVLEARRHGSKLAVRETIKSKITKWNAQAETQLLAFEIARLANFAGQAPGRANGIVAHVTRPVELFLACPSCRAPHLDDGSCHRKIPLAHHKTLVRPPLIHVCLPCGARWRPADFPTLGVDPSRFLLPSRGKLREPDPG